MDYFGQQQPNSMMQALQQIAQKNRQSAGHDPQFQPMQVAPVGIPSTGLGGGGPPQIPQKQEDTPTTPPQAPQSNYNPAMLMQAAQPLTADSIQSQLLPNLPQQTPIGNAFSNLYNNSVQQSPSWLAQAMNYFGGDNG